MSLTRVLSTWLFCASCAMCSASVSTDQARGVAEEALGVSLREAESRSVDAAGSTLYEFTLVAPEGGRTAARVDASTGLLFDFHLAFTRPDGSAPATMTEREAIDAAQRVANRLLPDGADSLVWSVRDADELVVLLEADGPPVGDPPRSGLSPHCEAMVSLVDGTVYSYGQVLPRTRTPLDPVVLAERATEIGQAERGGGNCIGDPVLGQHGDALTWYVKLGPPPNDLAAGASVVRVDALTGRVLSVERAGGSGTPSASTPLRPRASTDAVPAMHPRDQAEARRKALMRWALPALGATMFACVAVALVLLRRRK